MLTVSIRILTRAEDIPSRFRVFAIFFVEFCRSDWEVLSSSVSIPLEY
jgi:hypothetical protein